MPSTNRNILFPYDLEEVVPTPEEGLKIFRWFLQPPLDDMMMLLTFSTGEQRLFDATVLAGPAFEPLKDEKVFKNCQIVDRIVTWMNEEIDCAPEYMYENSYAYSSPAFAI